MGGASVAPPSPGFGGDPCRPTFILGLLSEVSVPRLRSRPYAESHIHPARAGVSPAYPDLGLSG